MLRKIFVAALTVSVLSVTACSTVAPSQGYRSAGSTEAPWQIGGELFDITNVKIFINGVKIIDDRLSLFSGDGDFHASYSGKQISASCTTNTGLLAKTIKCFVFVENEKAATLSF
jgi:hypothetical protein